LGYTGAVSGTLENLTDFPDGISISDAALVNKGWVRGAGESLVLFVVEVKGRSSGYLTVSPLADVLWIREFYLDGRTWRGAPRADAQPVLHRGLGKLILAYFDEWARHHSRSLGIFTTRSYGLLRACDHLFGSRCFYHVTAGDPPQTLYRQHGLGWLASIEEFSAILPPNRVLVFRKTGAGCLDERIPLEVWRLVTDADGTLRAQDPSGRTHGPEDGLLVSIGPSVDIVVSR